MLCFLLCKKQRCCAKMHLMQKCIFATHHILFCKNAFLHQQNVTNAFDAKMHFCNATLCKNAFDAKMHFCNASHFPKENVQHHIFQRKMFSIKYIFASNAVFFALQKTKMLNIFQSQIFSKKKAKKQKTKNHRCVGFTFSTF